MSRYLARLGAAALARWEPRRQRRYEPVLRSEDGVPPAPRRGELGFSEYGEDEETIFEDTPLGGSPSKPYKRVVQRSWKAMWVVFAVTAYVLFAWQGLRLIQWSEHTSPGLTSSSSSSSSMMMPVYSTSLGCTGPAAPFLSRPARAALRIPIGTERADHLFEVRGAAVGTLTIARGAAGAPDDAAAAVAEISVRTDDAGLVGRYWAYVPQAEADGRVLNSHFTLFTPNAGFFAERAQERGGGNGGGNGTACMRFDVVLRVPAALRRLHVVARAVAQVRFEEGAGDGLESLEVTGFAEDARAIVLLSAAGAGARRVGVEAHGGWVVGEVGIRERVAVTTRGKAVGSLRVWPEIGIGKDMGAKVEEGWEGRAAELRTVSGEGRMEVVYERARGAAWRRAIHSQHYSAVNGEVQLTYRGAGFEGRVEVDARAVRAHGVHGLGVHGGGGGEGWVGDRGGRDEVVVAAPAAWVGLSF